MALKDHWKPRIDGVDDADSTAVNEIAEEVINTQNKVESLEKKQTSTEESQARLSARVDEISEKQINLDNEVKNLDTKIKGFNSLFANALKGSASGDGIAINVSPVEHTMAVKVSSKNLIPYPYAETTKTQNGITFTDNGDGTITANGTATNLTDFILAYNYQIRKGMLISGAPNGQSDSTYEIQAYLDVNNFISTYGYPTSKTDYIAPNVRIRISSGATLNNVVFKPQIELGKTATFYTAYVPDLTAVKVSRCGKNLLSYPYAETTKILNGITITDIGDGSISLSGTSKGQVTFYFSTNLQLKNGITYTLSASGNYSFSGTASFYIYNSTYGSLAYINLNVSNSYTFTPKKDINGISCYIVIPSGLTVSGTLKPQLELGSAATDYEPYISSTDYTTNADGTVDGVTSLYPNTTLVTNTAGAVIDCEYNRDINRAFEELTQAIISLGGNF